MEPEFQYGDPHPRGVDLRRRGHEAMLRFSALHLGMLDEMGKGYLKGGENVLRALSQFDQEEGNIRRGQQWAAEHRAGNDAIASLCRDYPDSGAHIIDLRLSVRDRVAWLEEAVEACRQMGDRPGE